METGVQIETSCNKSTDETNKVTIIWGIKLPPAEKYGSESEDKSHSITNPK